MCKWYPRVDIHVFLFLFKILTTLKQLNLLQHLHLAAIHLKLYC